MSKITAILPVRNGAWCIGITVRALLLFCDEVVVFNHASTDQTLDILHEIQGEDKRLVYFSGTDPVWREMAHRQRLLESARERKATHIVTIDDDEVLTGTLLSQIRDLILNIPSGHVMQLPWLQLRGGINRYISTGMWASNRASMAFPDDPRLCWQTQTGGYDHHHRHPMGLTHKPYFQSKNGLMHCQMASRRRLAAKQFWYLLTERLRWPTRKTAAELNAIYGPTVHTDGAKDAPVPAEWWHGYEHLMQYLDLDAEPWQEQECFRIIRENPGIEKGLDHFGVLNSAHEAVAPEPVPPSTASR